MYIKGFVQFIMDIIYILFTFRSSIYKSFCYMEIILKLVKLITIIAIIISKLV